MAECQRLAFSFPPFRLDPSQRLVTRDGQPLSLTPKEFDTLLALVEAAGRVVDKEELINRVWPDSYVGDGSLARNVSVLRKTLGEGVIETHRGRGYRIALPVVDTTSNSVIVPSALTKPGDAPAESQTGDIYAEASLSSIENVLSKAPHRTWRSISSWVMSLAVLLAVIASGFVAIGLASGKWHLRSSEMRQIDSIAVLPFANAAGDADADYLSDGITEALISNLVRVPGLKVKSRGSVFEYKGKKFDPHKIGNDLGVSALVSGRVVPHGDILEVTAELVDARDNTEIWAQQYSNRSTEIITLQQRIARDIALKLRSTLSTSERQRVTRQATQNPDAYESYLKGRYYWNKRTIVDVDRAIGYFNQAIATDPGYALAYSGLADSYAILSTYGGNPTETYAKATAAAFRALELDPTLAHPHAVLGNAEMEYDWDFAAGEAEYKKSFELDPDDATAHHWYAQDIGWMGRSDEALAEVNLAHQLEPTSLMVTTEIGMVDLTARKFDDAVAVCSKVESESPAFAQAHGCLALAYWGKRDYPKVIDEWKAVGQFSRDQNLAELATAMEQGYRAGDWKGALRRGIAIRKEQRKRGYLPAYYIAAFYADLGNKDEAFRWLDVAFQERDVFLVDMPTDYLLDSLRSDLRFAELGRKMGLRILGAPQLKTVPDVPVIPLANR